MSRMGKIILNLHIVSPAPAFFIGHGAHSLYMGANKKWKLFELSMFSTRKFEKCPVNK